MYPTIYQFSQALLTPDASFTTLCPVTVRCGANGLPIVRRTTRYMEAQIEWQGDPYLLSVPFSKQVASQQERLIHHLQRLKNPALVLPRYMEQELLVLDNDYCEHRVGVILQALPGEALTDALPHLSAEELANAIDGLKRAMRSCGFAHRNLKAENLRWQDGRLQTIRYADATIDGDTVTDAAALAALYTELIGEERLFVSNRSVEYNPLPKFTGHRWVGNEFEGLICVEEEAGYGYVDAYNRIVIQPQFRWADDFHEGRAVVETESGMGLINKEGAYVIPPIYEIVEYRYSDSLIQARSNGIWAQFDLLGRQISPFAINYEL